LVKLNGKYLIVTDIEKTYVQGHRIPIDDQLVDILAVLVQRSKDLSNKENNPEEFIFIRYRGSRKGMPFNQGNIQLELNKLAIQKNIVVKMEMYFILKLTSPDIRMLSRC
jgi:integrase